jgi:diacylglycerol kinase (ATP)
MKQALIIVNAHSRKNDAGVGAFAHAMTSLGYTCEVRTTHDAQSARNAARDAVNRSFDTVIAAGGDGTVHYIAQELIRTKTALGILPIGTGNDIARALGIRGTQADYGNRPTLVDVAYIPEFDRWFMAVLATGFDAKVNHTANQLGWGRYVKAALRELVSLSAIDYKVIADNQQMTGRATLVAVGNLSTYGGGMRICPHARATDELLDITWVDEVSRTTLVRFFPHIFSGKHITRPEVRTAQAQSIHIQGPQHTAYADGEPIGAPPLSVSIAGGALLVHRPRGDDETG